VVVKIVMRANGNNHTSGVVSSSGVALVGDDASEDRAEFGSCGRGRSEGTGFLRGTITLGAGECAGVNGADAGAVLGSCGTVSTTRGE
jgi:hypothetical protein